MALAAPPETPKHATTAITIPTTAAVPTDAATIAAVLKVAHGRSVNVQFPEDGSQEAVVQTEGLTVKLEPQTMGILPQPVKG